MREGSVLGNRVVYDSHRVRTNRKNICSARSAVTCLSMVGVNLAVSPTETLQYARGAERGGA